MKDERDNGARNITLELPFKHEAVKLIPIDSIRVLNPRSRDQKKFQQIVQSISRVGLKKPITVSRRAGSEDAGATATYDLVCGQGRLEAFCALGETEIPALVGTFTMEERLLMSLAENITRHQPLRFEHIQQLLTLKERGYSTKQISEKVDVSESYLSAIFLLWERGEERLLRAVEAGTIPINTAIEIAKAPDEAAQRILADAYESEALVGRKLLAARRILEERSREGKKITLKRHEKRPASAEGLARTYQREIQRQRLFVRKARLCETRLAFVVAALKQLYADENFVTLLRAEGLTSLPKYLADETGIRVL